MFLILLCIRLAVKVGAELAPPQDVALITSNTNYALSWDWQQTSAESHSVTFTTQYIGKHQLKKKKNSNWVTVCNETLDRSCDLTALNLHYMCIYMLRVRANMYGCHSKWVLKEFQPKKDAALGPPTKVKLVPAGSDLDVFITNPGTSMKNYIGYHIVYWERSADSQSQMLSSNATIVTLPNLKAWTWYCVRVRSKVYDRSSNFTSPQCMQTEGDVPWWQIFLYFLAVLGTCSIGLLLLYSLFRCYRTIKIIFYPSNQLPLHLKNYICGFSGFDVPGVLIPDPESELLCEMVTVCVGPTFTQIYNAPPEVLLVSPSGLEPDNRNSHQDSSSSEDSGLDHLWRFTPQVIAPTRSVKGKERS